jgi:hypothetical protein
MGETMKQFEKMFHNIDGFMNNLIKYLCLIIPSYFLIHVIVYLIK